MGGLAALFGFGRRALEGAIGLEHEMARVDLGGGDRNLRQLGIEHKASEGNDVAQGRDLCDLLPAALEAMEAGAQPTGERRQNAKRIGPHDGIVALADVEVRVEAEFRGQVVNRLGYWGSEFESSPQPGVFRIAAVGDGVMLSGTAETNFLAQLRRRMPHVEVYNFGIPEAGPREYAAQVACDVANYQPNLVLAFVSVRDDVTQELPVPSYFEWQGLGLYQLGLRAIAASLRWASTVCSRIAHG